MSQLDPTVMFNEAHAARYDAQFARANVFREAIHLVTDFAFAGLPENARILVVGAGTGAEIIALAARHPGWHFTAVDPAAAMLDVFREKAAAAGILERCTVHVGYIESLPDTPVHDASTSLLVSHFLQTEGSRGAFFAEIAHRLKPGGLLVNADLAADLTDPASGPVFAAWDQMMTESGATPEGLSCGIWAGLRCPSACSRRCTDGRQRVWPAVASPADPAHPHVAGGKAVTGLSKPNVPAGP